MTQLQRAVLQAIAELGENAYGVPVRRRVDEILGRRWFWQQTSIGALYVAFEQLEGLGLISHYEMPGGLSRGGRPKRHLYLTRQGVAEITP